MTWLSIITPTLNSAETLADTLSAIAPLLKAGAEHIVVDSGSEDATVEIARRAGSDVIYHPPGNMYAAINAGMETAKGDWLTYINGDDILFADSTLEALAAVDQSIAVIYGDIDFIDEYGRFLFSRRSPNPRHLSWLMRYYNPFLQQGSLFRHRVYEELGGFRTEFRFAGDFDFFVRCVLHGEQFWKFQGKSVAAFRLSDKQLSQRARKELRPEAVQIRSELRERVERVADWLGRPAANVYRWSTNLDGILLRWQRGRGQDAAWKT